MDIITGENSVSSLTFTKETDGEEYLYVFKEKDYNLKVNDYFCDNYPGLVDYQPETGAGYGVYDVIAGKQLLDTQYDDILFTNQYVYSYKDGVWEVYEIQ